MVHRTPVGPEETTMHASTLTLTAAAFELRFTSLFHAGRALAFPCDASGRVDLDRLSERARTNYFYARAVGGREFSRHVIPVAKDACHG